MKKVRFRPIENERDKPASPGAVAEDTEVEDSCQVCEILAPAKEAGELKYIM